MSSVPKEFLSEGIHVYHGSDRKFDKFDITKVGSGDGKNLGGWGIYFSDNIEVCKRYNSNTGFLKEFELYDGDYFDFDETISDGNRIMRQLRKIGVDDNEIEQFQTDYLDYGDVTNRQAYEWLGYVLGGQKEASLFLKSIGYTGNTMKDRWDEGRNYIVFDTDDIIYK